MDPTERFSARADVYGRARPSYPHRVIELLRERCGLHAGVSVADLGSGTGIFTRLLLDAGARVAAVEPNADMRAEAERTLGGLAGFRSIAGRAEATGLDDASIDVVSAAQAFHWFDVEPTRREIARILRPDGGERAVAFVWNDRDTGGTPFLRAFESLLLEHCAGYRELQGKSATPEKFDAFFGQGRWMRDTADNEQLLDRVGLVERVLSASYVPPDGTELRARLVRALESAFDRHAENGQVRIVYTSVVISGRPRPA